MRARNCIAFSLVEVTLALGIASFCLLVIFSLLPIGLKSNLESSEETSSTGILSQVTSDLQMTPVTIPNGGAATTEQFKIPVPANPVTSDVKAASRYFSESGYDGTTVKPDSRYKVDITFLSNANASGAMMALVKASWPANAATPVGKIETLVALDRN